MTRINQAIIESPLSAFSNAKSISFGGGTQFVDCGDIVALKGINKMTTSTWIKLTTGIAGNAVFLTKWDHQTQTTFAFGLLSTTGLRLFFANTITDAGSTSESTGNLFFVLDSWHHIGVVYDGTLANTDRVKIYKDAVLVGSSTAGTLPTALTTGSASVKFGRFGGSLIRPWKGGMDEPKIFLSAFNQAEITEIYNSGSPNDVTGHSQAANLNNNWRFGDGDTFPTLTDLQSGDNGIMTNMVAGDIVSDVP